MRRRRVMILLASAVTAILPLVGRAQHPERVGRIGILLPFDNADDSQVRQLWPAFKQRLGGLGWVEAAIARLVAISAARASIGRLDPAPK